MKKLVFLELNELNFEYVNTYIRQGQLPHFAQFFKEHGYCETTAENIHEHLEPWIQWVSIHTGMPFKQHRIFRLGDVVGSRPAQIWELLEEKGLKVGAISPMNAENRLKKPAFFLPDPWTKTLTSGSFLIKNFARAISQAVNDNAANKMTMKSLLFLLLGFGIYSGTQSLATLIDYFCHARKSKWYRAMILDRFLADLFIKLWKKKRPHFSSLFLNGAAHIQHHYLFNSRCYSGPYRNPPWYAPSDQDPVLDIYMLYDKILGDVMGLDSRPRIMIATGLHQKPHRELTYYYRLRNPAKFCNRLGIRFKSVAPRMSRDFLIDFEKKQDCLKMELALKSIRDKKGISLFGVDNRGSNLFVTLTYPHEISSGFTAYTSNRMIPDFSDQVVFVALKNADHDPEGYFADSVDDGLKFPEPFYVWEIRNRILAAFE